MAASRAGGGAGCETAGVDKKMSADADASLSKAGFISVSPDAANRATDRFDLNESSVMAITGGAGDPDIISDRPINRGNLMNTHKSILMASTLLIAAPAVAATEPGTGQVIGYFLPKTEIAFVVSQRITACPEAGKPPEFATEIQMKPQAVADKYIAVDIRSGWLAERTTKLSLRANGTLESFNADTKGQGGKVVGAIAKVAGVVAGFAAPEIAAASALATFAMSSNKMFKARFADPTKPVAPDPIKPDPLICKKTTSDALQKITTLSTDIKTIETRIISAGGNAVDEAQLERLRTKVTKTKSGLTLTSEATIDPRVPHQHVNSVDFLKWFEANANDVAALEANKVVGRYGYVITVQPDTNVKKIALAGDGTRIEGPSPYLVYQRPVPTELAAMPCGVLVEQSIEPRLPKILANDCKIDGSDEALEIRTTKIVPVAQSSGYFSLKVGKGGIFGSRQAKAKFDEFGTPLELEYGTAGGSADIADTLGTVADSAKAIDGSELTALEQQIKLEEAQKKLADLRAKKPDE